MFYDASVLWAGVTTDPGSHVDGRPLMAVGERACWLRSSQALRPRAPTPIVGFGFSLLRSLDRSSIERTPTTPIMVRLVLPLPRDGHGMRFIFRRCRHGPPATCSVHRSPARLGASNTATRQSARGGQLQHGRRFMPRGSARDAPAVACDRLPRYRSPAPRTCTSPILGPLCRSGSANPLFVAVVSRRVGRSVPALVRRPPAARAGSGPNACPDEARVFPTASARVPFAGRACPSRVRYAAAPYFPRRRRLRRVHDRLVTSLTSPCRACHVFP